MVLIKNKFPPCSFTISSHNPRHHHYWSGQTLQREYVYDVQYATSKAKRRGRERKEFSSHKHSQNYYFQPLCEIVHYRGNERDRNQPFSRSNGPWQRDAAHKCFPVVHPLERRNGKTLKSTFNPHHCAS